MGGLKPCFNDRNFQLHISCLANRLLEIILKQPCQKENFTSSMPKRKAKVIIVFTSSAMKGHAEDSHWHVDGLSPL